MKIRAAIKENIMSLIGVIVFAAIFLAPAPPGLEYEGKAALAILALAFFLWASEAVPIGATAWLVGILLILLGVRKDPNAVWMPFAHTNVFFLIGSFVMTQGLIRYNVHKKIALLVLSISGTSVNSVIFGIVITSGLLSAFISDHLVAAMMLPLGYAIVESLGGGAVEHPKFAKLMMLSIAFSVNSTGFSTPSGGARNLIIMSYLNDMFGISVSYWRWMIYAFPVGLLIVLATGIVLPRIIKSEIEDLKPAIEKLKREDVEFPLKAKISIGIFVITILLFILKGSEFGLGTIAMLGAFLMIVLGILEWNDVRKISWNSVFLYGAAISLGNALKDTHASAWLAGGFLSILGIKTLPRLILVTTAISALNTNIMADGPNAAILGPIVLGFASQLKVNPLVAGLAVVIPGSFAYMTLIGTPPNAIVYGSGYLEAKDFLKYGIIQIIISLAVWLLMLNTYWRYMGLI